MPRAWPRQQKPRPLSFLDAPLAARLIFSAKESFYKCQFYRTRKWLDLFDVEVRFEAGGNLSAVLLVEAPPLPRGLVVQGRWQQQQGLFLTTSWLPCADP